MIEYHSDLLIWSGFVIVCLAFYVSYLITTYAFWGTSGKLDRILMILGFFGFTYIWVFTIFPVVHAYLEMR